MRLLVAFDRQVTPHDTEHGSIVIERPNFPGSDDDFYGLEYKIAEIFGDTRALQVANVSPLPESGLHPTDNGKYRYFFTYRGRDRTGFWFGRGTVDLSLPATSTADIRLVEEFFRRESGYNNLSLLSCWPIR